MHVLTELPSRRRSIEKISGNSELVGLCLAIGNFDGVHLGHHALIKTCQEISQEARKEIGADTDAKAGRIGVLTFAPHPRQFFEPDAAPFLLTTPHEKARRLQALGVDEVISLPFTSHLSRMSAIDFATDLIASGLSPAHVVIGHDFHFGVGRSGSPDLMAEWLAAHKIGCTIVAPQTDATGQIHGSREIRCALAAGELALANASLVAPWSVSGKIIRGDQIGRTLGFPTANVELPKDLIRIRFGVYAAKCMLEGMEGDILGAVSFGTRPAVKGREERFEVHLLDFEGDIYGKMLSVQPTAFIRPEWDFESLDALTKQIRIDVDQIRNLNAPTSDIHKHG